MTTNEQNDLTAILQAHNEKGSALLNPAPDPVCKCGHLESDHYSRCRPAECGIDHCVCERFGHPLPSCPECDEQTLLWIRVRGYVECQNQECCWSFSPISDVLVRATVISYYESVGVKK